MKHGLSVHSTGQLKRDLGNPQKRFYLGTEPGEAKVRCARLEQVWTVQKGRVGVWDSVSLAIAKACSRGETVCYLDGPEGMEAFEQVTWLFKLQQDFPFILLKLTDQTAFETGKQELDPVVNKLADDCQQKAKKAKQGLETYQQFASGNLAVADGTLFQALDVFGSVLRKKFVITGTDKPSPTGTKNQRWLVILKEHWRDMPLSSFGLKEIEEVLEYWRKRPQTKRGKIAAVDTCREIVKLIRSFIKWLHRSPDFSWRKPADYEVAPLRIPLTREEISKKANGVATYKLDEVATLFKIATPWERLLMLLALNCGWGRDNVASLYTEEIKQGDNKTGLDLNKPFDGKLIVKVRQKTSVLGRWVLWDVTKEAIEWYRRHRPQFDRPEFLITKNGVPLAEPTKGGNPNMKISSAWTCLHNRIKRDLPNFRKLSFNKLKKTAIDWIRKLAGGEVARVFMMHGQPVQGDDLAERYSNRYFRPVFKALRRLERKLQKHVFSQVENPFPDEVTHAVVSQGQKTRITQLRGQGYKINKIAEILELDRNTVSKYLRTK